MVSYRKSYPITFPVANQSVNQTKLTPFTSFWSTTDLCFEYHWADHVEDEKRQCKGGKKHTWLQQNRETKLNKQVSRMNIPGPKWLPLLQLSCDIVRNAASHMHVFTRFGNVCVLDYKARSLVP